ncbi:MAG: hypothetical protein AB1483_00370 [Candidatus Zixiibacteriota bacterium]
MVREKDSISQSEFENFRDTAFSNAAPEIREFAQTLADYCWQLDNFAVLQDWEGKPKSLIVFGLPQEKRARSNAKNYFSIFSVIDGQQKALKCEVILPKGDREALMDKHDTEQKLYVSTIDQVTGEFVPHDLNYVKGLINLARDQREK